jgi:hypothetical protein
MRLAGAPLALFRRHVAQHDIHSAAVGEDQFQVLAFRLTVGQVAQVATAQLRGRRAVHGGDEVAFLQASLRRRATVEYPVDDEAVACSCNLATVKPAVA